MTDDQIIQLARQIGFGPAAEWPGIREMFIQLVRLAIKNAKDADPWH